MQVSHSANHLGDPSAGHHDLSDLYNDQILTVESLIVSCYANPNRRKFAKFQSDTIRETDPTDTAKSLIERILQEIPVSVLKFNDARIELHDTSFIHESSDNGQDVDINQYLHDVRHSKWHGPFRDSDYADGLAFYTLNSDASNQYWIKVQICFDT